MRVHLIDGTYELFRHYFAVPSAHDSQGREIGAVRGVMNSLFTMLQGDATHIGVATDHVIESFRNQLWPTYKSGAGVAPDLLSQFPLLEEGLRAMGVVVWAMTEYEADDALATAAAMAARDPRVDQVVICTPDKDLAQCVRGDHVVQLDRRSRVTRDHGGVVAKFGVEPASIPDYLALVGDSADGFPGLRGWGAKSAATVLARFLHLEAIPANAADWNLNVASARTLAATLVENREQAYLFRDLATLRNDVPLTETVDDLQWRGARPEFAALAESFKADRRGRS